MLWFQQREKRIQNDENIYKKTAARAIDRYGLCYGDPDRNLPVADALVCASGCYGEAGGSIIFSYQCGMCDVTCDYLYGR